MNDSDLAARLLRFLQDRASPAAPPLRLDSALFGIGTFDSLALVELVVWVEQELGTAVDTSRLDLEQEWATVADLAAFIARHREANSDGSPREQRGP